MAIVGIVTGLEAEAVRIRRALARRPPEAEVRVACHGPGPVRARAAARALLEDGAEALASVGLAGGLKPNLWPGMVVIAREVVTAAKARSETDAGWRGRLIAHLMGDDEVIEGRLYGADAPVLDAAAKAALYAASEAVAVDLESHAVAAIARDAQVPFMAVRAIADSPQHSVPVAALRGMRDDGSVTPWPVLARLAARPWRLWDFAAAALDGRRGLAGLSRVLAVTGAVGGLAFAGLGLGEEA